MCSQRTWLRTCHGFHPASLALGSKLLFSIADEGLGVHTAGGASGKPHLPSAFIDPAASEFTAPLSPSYWFTFSPRGPWLELTFSTEKSFQETPKVNQEILRLMVSGGKGINLSSPHFPNKCPHVKLGRKWKIANGSRSLTGETLPFLPFFSFVQKADLYLIFCIYIGDGRVF